LPTHFLSHFPPIKTITPSRLKKCKVSGVPSTKRASASAGPDGTAGALDSPAGIHRSREGAPFGDKLLAAMRNQFGGHAVKGAK
jgi:hypothetical protein